MRKEKDNIDDIFDEEDSSIGMSSHSVVTGQALAAILSQLTTLSNRIAAIESKDSPIEADISVSREAEPRVSSQCKKRTASTVDFSKQPTEENPSTSSAVDNRSSIRKVDLSDDAEYDTSQEDKQPIPSYSDTLFTIKKWLDIDITETDTIIAPSVFSQASKLKKSAEVSLALPPAENMVSFVEFQGV